MPNNTHTIRIANEKEKGTVLLLALLIMSTVVLSASGLSSLILSSLQQTRIIDSSIIAYYAAESGIEDALYARKVDRLGIPSTDINILPNGADWSRKVVDSEVIIYTNILQDSFVELSLYRPDADLTATSIAVVRVDWADDCMGCSAMQASVVGWQPGAVIDWTASSETSTQRSPVSPLWFNLTNPGDLYRLRLKGLNGDLRNVEVRAFDDAGNPIPIPGRVRIDAQGNYSDAQQRISVTLPQQVPALGLFDYAIYSECSIVKGGPATCMDPVVAP